MKKLFKKQLDRNILVSKDEFNDLNKTYFNGDKINLGDIVLYALLLDKSTNNVTLIALNQQHFNLFCYNEDNQSEYGLPIISLI